MIAIASSDKWVRRHQKCKCLKKKGQNRFFLFQKQRQKFDKGTRTYNVNCTVIFRKTELGQTSVSMINKELVSQKE